MTPPDVLARALAAALLDGAWEAERMLERLRETIAAGGPWDDRPLRDPIAADGPWQHALARAM